MLLGAWSLELGAWSLELGACSLRLFTLHLLQVFQMNMLHGPWLLHPGTTGPGIDLTNHETLQTLDLLSYFPFSLE